MSNNGIDKKRKSIGESPEHVKNVEILKRRNAQLKQIQTELAQELAEMEKKQQDLLAEVAKQAENERVIDEMQKKIAAIEASNKAIAAQANAAIEADEDSGELSSAHLGESTEVRAPSLHERFGHLKPVPKKNLSTNAISAASKFNQAVTSKKLSDILHFTAQELSYVVLAAYLIERNIATATLYLQALCPGRFCCSIGEMPQRLVRELTDASAIEPCADGRCVNCKVQHEILLPELLKSDKSTYYSFNPEIGVSAFLRYEALRNALYNGVPHIQVNAMVDAVPTHEWKTVIAAFCHADKINEAVLVVKFMQKKCITIDLHGYSISQEHMHKLREEAVLIVCNQPECCPAFVPELRWVGSL